LKEVTYQVHLWDELPRIGSGFRLVVVKEGRKWVYVRSYSPVEYPKYQKKQKIHKKIWEKIKMNKSTRVFCEKTSTRQ